MGLLRYLLRRLDALAQALVMVAAGLGLSQLSAFMQQYMQNLAGRLAEARADLAGLLARAAEAGLPVEAYIDTFLTATNPLFVREGEALRAKIAHVQDLTATYDALQAAGLWDRPVVFATRLDPAIAADVWAHFQPAVPIDTASLIYAGLGLVAAMFLYELLRALLVAPFRRPGRAAPVRQHP